MGAGQEEEEKLSLASEDGDQRLKTEADEGENIFWRAIVG